MRVRTSREALADRLRPRGGPSAVKSSTPPETNIVSGTTLRLACGPSAPQERTVLSSLFSPNQRNNLSGTKLRLAGGPSAPHGRTVRRSTLKPKPEKQPLWYKFE